MFEVGNWWHPERKKEENAVEEIPMGILRSVSTEDRLRLRLYESDFFFHNERQKHGVLMHEVLSRIRTPNDNRHPLKAIESAA